MLDGNGKRIDVDRERQQAALQKIMLAGHKEAVEAFMRLQEPWWALQFMTGLSKKVDRE